MFENTKDGGNQKRWIEGGQTTQWGRFIVFNATLNSITVISWWSVLLVEETGVPGENHRPVETGQRAPVHIIDTNKSYKYCKLSIYSCMDEKAPNAEGRLTVIRLFELLSCQILEVTSDMAELALSNNNHSLTGSNLFLFMIYQSLFQPWCPW